MPTVNKERSTMPQLSLLVVVFSFFFSLGMTELQNALHDQSTWNRIISFLGLSKVGGLEGNPFVRASELLAQARVALISFGSLVAGGVTIVQSARVMGNETWNSAKALVSGKDVAKAPASKPKEEPAPAV